MRQKAELANLTSTQGAADAQKFKRLVRAHKWSAVLDLARKRFGPDLDQPMLFVRIGEVLSHAGMIDQADDCLEEGLTRWPNDVWLLHYFAELATFHRSFDVALLRWNTLIDRAPDSPLGPCGCAMLYRITGNEDEAARRFDSADRCYPDYIWAADGHANTPTRRHDWAEAVKRWALVAERFPDYARAHEELVQAMLAAEQPQAARLAVRRGLSLFPQSTILLAATARVDELLATLIVVPAASGVAVRDIVYRCPDDLAVSPTALRRVIVIGSCMVGAWPEVFMSVSPGCAVEQMLVNNSSVLPAAPPYPALEYDFQVLQVPLRSVMPEAEYLRLPQTDPVAFERLFELSRDRLSRMLWEMMRWNREHGILTFVLNFLVPQQNPIGRLQPRYDLRNPVYFVERLNQILAEEINTYRNAYLFDHDQIVANFGRRHIQDDQLWVLSHGSALADGDWDNDQNRLEAVQRPSSYYPVATHQFVLLAWAELQAMYRTVRQFDMVKLVLIDLDDTLWRGVIAEGGEGQVSVREGWPLGFVEALLFLKQRGVLLGIVSKNDEERALETMRHLWGSVLRPDDFAVRKINWRPKADNIEEILTEVNLLPRSVVFIDDNPVERASVKMAFPEMRVLGANPYLWRRILLWSAETQISTLTAESAARTTMVQAQVEREGQRKRMSREEFLASLDLRADFRIITSIDDKLFPRVIELINKTNQFNTNGRRWTTQELDGLFTEGGKVWTLDVTDKYTAYGVVGVLIVRSNEIIQFVMSCRVVGMDVELAAVSAVLAGIAVQNFANVTATLIETRSNLLCRDLWQRCGFTDLGDGRFQRSTSVPLHGPAHISSIAVPTSS